MEKIILNVTFHECQLIEDIWIRVMSMFCLKNMSYVLHFLSLKYVSLKYELSLKYVLSLKCPAYEIRLIFESALSMKCANSEMVNNLSMKCPYYEMSLLWNVLTMK